MQSTGLNDVEARRSDLRLGRLRCRFCPLFRRIELGLAWYDRNARGSHLARTCRRVPRLYDQPPQSQTEVRSTGVQIAVAASAVQSAHHLPGQYSGLWMIWMGRQGSNLRMAESKSAALPLGDAPTAAIRHRNHGPPPIATSQLRRNTRSKKPTGDFSARGDHPFSRAIRPRCRRPLRHPGSPKGGSW